MNTNSNVDSRTLDDKKNQKIIDNHENGKPSASDNKAELTRTTSRSTDRNYKSSVSFSEHAHVQHQVQQYQLSIHRQNSLRFSTYKKKNDLESRLNRM